MWIDGSLGTEVFYLIEGIIHSIPFFFFFSFTHFRGPRELTSPFPFLLPSVTMCVYVLNHSLDNVSSEQVRPTRTRQKKKKKRKKKNWVNGNEADLVEEGLLFGSAWLTSYNSASNCRPQLQPPDQIGDFFFNEMKKKKKKKIATAKKFFNLQIFSYLCMYSTVHI